MSRAAIVAVGALLPAPESRRFVVPGAEPRLARSRRLLSRSAELAARAVLTALDDAAAAGHAVDPAETAAFLAVGASTGALDDLARILAASTEEGRLDLPRFARKGVAACNPLLAFQLMNNFTLCHAAIQCGLMGPNGALYGGARHALDEAIHALDEVPWALAGAADSALHPLSDPVLAARRPGEGAIPEGAAGLGEAAVVLLLAREADSPIAWIEPAEGEDLPDMPLMERFGDCLTAAPALRWILALEQLKHRLAVSVDGFRFWREPGSIGSGVQEPASDPAEARVPPDSRRRSGGAHAGALGGPLIAEVSCERPESAGGRDVGANRRSRERPSRPPTAVGRVTHSEARTPAGAAHRSGAYTSGAPSCRRAVITGVGVASAYGLGVAALWDGLLSNQIALRPIPHLPGFPDGGALPPGLDPLDGVPGPLRDAWEARGWTRDRRLGLAVWAALEAWEHARRPERLALSLGLGLEQAWMEDFFALLPGPDATALDWTRDPCAPPLRFRAPLDLPARALRELLPLHGPDLLNASACAAGTLAVAQAAAWIERGLCDAVLAGGADSMLNPLGLAGLGRLGVLSPRGACRPFDLRRDGILVGEGAACFVVEEESAARARGATVLARVTGWGSRQDGYAPTAPRPGGEPARRAMQAALDRAGIHPELIGYVNAHGTGTPANDEVEAAAIRAIWPEGPLVGSFKGAFGHGMAAAGALEIAGCLVAFARGQLPGTPGFLTPDPQVPLDVVRGARPFRGRCVLTNSFGFGGQDASLVLEAP